MGYQSTVKSASDYADPLPKDSVVTLRIERYTGPHPSTKIRDKGPRAGQLADPFMKVFFQVIGPDEYAGEELDTIVNSTIGGDKSRSRELFQAAFGRDLQDEETVEWDDLLNKTLQAVTGVKNGNQGTPMFTTLEKFMRLPARRGRAPQQQAARPAAPPSEDADSLDDVPF